MLKDSKLIAVILVCGIGCASNAAAKEADLTQQFAGEPLAGRTSATSPWITASFSQLSDNSVQVSFGAPGLAPNQRVDSLYFNVNKESFFQRGFSPTTFTFAHVSGPQMMADLGPNRFQADRSGYYDMKISFDTRLTMHGESNSNLFTQGKTSVYTITGTGLQTTSFSAVSFGSSGQPFYAAGKILTSTGGSSWVSAAPEPEVYAMMLVGLPLIGFVARRRRNSQKNR